MTCYLIPASLMLLATVGWEQPTLAQPHPTMSGIDRAFVHWDLQIERAQRNMGEIAARRGRNPELRDFGSLLQVEHSAAYSALRKIAQPDDEERTPLGAIHVAVEKRYEMIPADRFDGQFLRHEIGDHRRFLGRFRMEAARGRNSELRAYASREIEVLEADLHEAEALLSHPEDGLRR